MWDPMWDLLCDLTWELMLGVQTWDSTWDPISNSHVGSRVRCHVRSYVGSHMIFFSRVASQTEDINFESQKENEELLNSCSTSSIENRSIQWDAILQNTEEGSHPSTDEQVNSPTFILCYFYCKIQSILKGASLG